MKQPLFLTYSHVNEIFNKIDPSSANSDDQQRSSKASEQDRISKYDNDESDLRSRDSMALDYSKSLIDSREGGMHVNFSRSNTNDHIFEFLDQNRIINYDENKLSEYIQLVEKLQQEIEQLRGQNQQLLNDNSERQQQKVQNNQHCFEKQMQDLKNNLDRAEGHLQLSDQSNTRLRQQMKDILSRQRETSDENQQLHSDLMQTKLELHEMKSKNLTQEKMYKRQIEKLEKDLKKLQSEEKQQESPLICQQQQSERTSIYEPQKLEIKLRGLSKQNSNDTFTSNQNGETPLQCRSQDFIDSTPTKHHPKYSKYRQQQEKQ